MQDNKVGQNSDVTILTPTQPQLTNIDPIALKDISKPNSLKDFYKKNQILVWLISTLLIVLIIVIILLYIRSNPSTDKTSNGVVSAPISRPVATTDPETTTPIITYKTIDFSIDNSFTISQSPINTISGIVFVTSDVNFTNPTKYSGVFKKGSSSFTITSFHEEYQHKLFDYEHIGETKALGDTYRVSEIGDVEGKVDYFYVNRNAIVIDGTCNPVSFPDPINSPCGVTNFKGYYFQCTGNTSFTFCDNIIKNLDFTINQN